MTAQKIAHAEPAPTPFWLLPAGAVAGAACFLSRAEGGESLQQAFIGAMWGAFGAVPVVIVAAFVMIGLHNRRLRRSAQAAAGDAA